MAEELDRAQTTELRADLILMGEEIERLLTSTKEGARTVDLDQPIGRLTRMDSLQMQSLAKANRSSLAIRRKQVRAALEAIEKGEYGLCRRCEEPVGYRRLKVRPETPFCISCQEHLESGR